MERTIDRVSLISTTSINQTASTHSNNNNNNHISTSSARAITGTTTDFLPATIGNKGSSSMLIIMATTASPTIGESIATSFKIPNATE